MYKRINLFSNNTTVAHDKSGIIYLQRSQEHLLSNYQFLMNGTEQKIRGQTIDKTMAKLGAWSETKKLKWGTVETCESRCVA